MTPIQCAADLRARIRELSDDEPDPAVITDRVLRSLTADDYTAVVAVTLHEYVRVTIKHGDNQATQTYETAGGARTPSAKVAALRDWVERELHRRVCVNENNQTWRFLTDCTAAELQAAVEIRRRKAAATLAEAEHYEAIAKAVEHAGVNTVGDLPRGTLEEVLKR